MRDALVSGEMRDALEEKLERSQRTARASSLSDRSAGQRLSAADDDAPTRAPRVDVYGRYDLSRDGVNGGCGTDEGY
jgi:hypothetical protein